MGMDPDVINFDDLPDAPTQPNMAAPQGAPDVIGFDDLPDAPMATVQQDVPTSGIMRGVGNALARSYYNYGAESGMADRFNLRAYKTSLEQGGDLESDIGELIMSGKATPEQNDLFMRRVPQTDPVWRAAELARVTNEMAKLDQSIAESEQGRQEYPAQSRDYQRLQAGIEKAKQNDTMLGKIGGVFGAAIDNPMGVPELFSEGGVSTARPVLGAFGAAIAARRGQLGPLAQKAAPIMASMGITGFDSYKSQISNIIEEKAKQGGFDLRKDPKAMDTLLDDVDFVNAVKSEALRAGVNDAGWAAFSTYLGISPRIKGVWQPVVQSAAEMGTEASRQLVTKGEVVDPTAIGVAGVTAGPFEGISYGVGRAAGVFGKPAAPGAPGAQAAPQAEPTTTPPPAAAPDVINVDDLPDAPRSVAGETEATPPSTPAPAQAGATPEWLKPAEPAAAQPEPVAEPVAPVAEAPAPVEQPAQSAAPAPVAVEPEATPAPAAEPVATPQPAPSAAYTGGDPKADPRFEGLLRNQRSKVNVLHNDLVNDQKKRERAVAEKRSTKNLDKRIAETTAEIEAALAKVPADKVKPVQPAAAPAPVAQPAQPAAQAEAPAPVAQPNPRTDAENTAPQSPQAEPAPVAEAAPVEQPKAVEPSPLYRPKAQEPSAERDAAYKRDVEATPLPKKQAGKVEIVEKPRDPSSPKISKDAEIYGDLAIVKGDNGKYGVVHTKTGLYLSQALPKKADAIGVVRAMTHGNVDFNFTDKSDSKWTKSEGPKAAQILIAMKNGVSPDFYKAAEAKPATEQGLLPKADVDPEISKIDSLKLSDAAKAEIKDRYLRDKKNYERRQRELEASRKLDAESRAAAEESRRLREQEAKAAEPSAEQPKQEAKPAEETKTADSTAESAPTQADLDGINDQLAEMERNKQGESPEAEALRQKRDAVQSKLDEAVTQAAEKGVPTEEGIIAALDKAAAEALDPKNVNEIFTSLPKLGAALTWVTAREIQKGLTNFAKWSADMARKFPTLKGSLKTIWARAQQIAKRPMDYIRFRALDSIADKVWQNAGRTEKSATLRKIANIVFAKAGPDADAVENDIPTRIHTVRNQFSNIYANIMERFAAEFRDMTPEQRRKWDEDFRAAVIDGTTPSDPKVAKAVADFRNLMRDMLAYQRNAGIEMGDQGGNYFPRNYDADAVEADRDGFVAAAQEMYRKREERLLNKAIADVRRAEKDRPAERRAADKKFGRKEKTDAEYRQEAAEWAQEKIAALEAEFAAKDDDFYKQKAEDWATAITHGDVLGLTLFKTTEGKVTSDSTDARTFTNDEAKLADAFLKKNIDDIMMGYIDGAVRGAEVGRIFGQDGSKFEQMMNQLSREGVDAETIKETRRLVQKALGVGREQQSQATAAFFDWVNVVLAGAFLGKTFMYNLVLEPISFGIRTGNAYLALKSMADTWRLTLAELGTPSAATRQRIEAKYGSQAAFAKSVTETVAEQVGLIQNEMERAYFNAHWDYSSDEKGSKLAKWISQRIYRANLMSATEKAKVQASIGIARLALRDNARFFTGDAPIQKLFGALGFDTKADKSAAVIMRENGVPDADHKAFAAWVAGLEGKTDAEWQKAVMDPKDPMAKHYRRALQRMSLGMSIKTNPALKMEMSDSVLGRLMMQLMNYSYAYSNLVKDRMYSMAAETVAKDASTIDRLRYAAPLMVGAPLAIMGAAASKALIAGLWPSDDEEKRSKETPMVRKAFNWASFAGMFGPKVEYLFKSFERGQAPGGPVGETIFRGGQAVFAAANDPDSEKKAYNARKQLYNSTVKPLVTGAGAAAHPFFGFLGNAAVNNQDVRETFTGQAPRK